MPALKHISVKGLADFMAASESKKRKIVHQYKYPQEDEARAKIIYYREAREVIQAFHTGDHDAEWLEELAGQLETIASSLTGSSRSRRRHNARAIRAYATNFAERNFRPLSVPRLRLDYSGIRINVVPDLRAREAGKEKIIKFEFGVDPPSDLEVKVISQMLFEASQVAGLGLPSSSVLYLDIERGREHRGARAGSQTRTNIEAACATISDIWDRI